MRLFILINLLATGAHAACRENSILSQGNWITYHRSDAGQVYYLPTELEPQAPTGFWQMLTQHPDGSRTRTYEWVVENLGSSGNALKDRQNIAHVENVALENVTDLSQHLSAAVLDFSYSSLSQKVESSAAHGKWVIKLPVVEAQLFRQSIQANGTVWGYQNRIFVEHACGRSETTLNSTLKAQQKRQQRVVSEVPFTYEFLEDFVLFALPLIQDSEEAPEPPDLTKEEACLLVESSLIKMGGSPMTAEFFHRIQYQGLSTHGGTLCTQLDGMQFWSLVTQARYPEVFLDAYAKQHQEHFGSLPPFYSELYDYQAKVDAEEKQTRVISSFNTKFEDGQWVPMSPSPLMELEDLRTP